MDIVEAIQQLIDKHRAASETLELPPVPVNEAEQGWPRTEAADPWAHRSARMSCATCMWFGIKAPSDPGVTAPLGRCRRRSPTMNGFPAVFETDWCGDHKLDENKA